MTATLSPNSRDLAKIITEIMEATGSEYTKRNIWLTIHFIRDMPEMHKYYYAASFTELHDAVSALAID